MILVPRVLYLEGLWSRKLHFFERQVLWDVISYKFPEMLVYFGLWNLIVKTQNKSPTQWDGSELGFFTTLRPSDKYLPSNTVQSLCRCSIVVLLDPFHWQPSSLNKQYTCKSSHFCARIWCIFNSHHDVIVLGNAVRQKEHETILTAWPGILLLLALVCWFHH